MHQSFINKPEPVDYDPTEDLVTHDTVDPPQALLCGFIAQSVEQAEALKHVVLGRGIDEDGKETGISLNCIAVFTCAVQEIQELSEIVKHNPNMHGIKTWHVLVYSFS